jgi:hypothetical protein
MFERFAISTRTVRALGIAGLLAIGAVQAPAVRAVSPGDNGRTVYLKAHDVVVFDGTFNHTLTNDHDWQERVTWCGRHALVGERAGIGIVEIHIDSDSTAGTPFTLYHDPQNSLHDPACNATGTRVAAAVGDTVVTIPTSGRFGPTPLAQTASGQLALEPAWSSDDRFVAFEDAIGSNVSAIEVASASGRFISGGTPVTPPRAGLRHGPSWWKNKVYYWKQATHTDPSMGIFSVRVGDTNEVGPYGGTDGSLACRDPAALPEGNGFECVGSDTFIKVFPGPKSLNDTDASKPDVEQTVEHEHHGLKHHDR